MKWHKGHIGRFWNEDFKSFAYVRQPITEQEVKDWESKGYDYVKSFTGVMYNNSNPMPDWTNRFLDIFHMYGNLTFTFYKMQTLEIMPEHSDHYRTYRRMHGAEYNDVVRILVMLEDWKPGHYLEIDGQGIVNWIAGDYFVWENDCPHAAANIGIQDRYTLQITGTKIKSEDIWHKVHWYNIPNLPTKAASKQPFLRDRILPTINNNDGKPMMIYLYNEELKDIKDLVHDQETVDYLNQYGLDIYLYEPICSYVLGAGIKYLNGTKHTLQFYSEFKGDEPADSLRVDEFESILEYKEKNKLTAIKVHTCDYDVANQYPHYKTQLELCTNDLFLKSVVPLKVLDETPSDNFTKRFICMNWRWTPHRHLMVIYLSQMDAHLSWYFRSDIYNIAKQPWYNLFEWSQDNPELFDLLMRGLRDVNRNVPYNLDLDLQEIVNIPHPYFRQYNPTNQIINHVKKDNHTGAEQFYRDAFCDIVNETRFAQPTANYSEKVYNAMFYKKPFIMVGPPKTLQYMKEEGFKTFSDFWDESYDDIYDHEKRLFAIFDLIKKLNDTPIQGLQSMYRAMIPILEHNYELLRKKTIPLENN